MYTQAWAIPHYVRLIFWPDQLTLDYGQRPITGLGGAPGAVLLTAFAAAVIFAWTRIGRWGWFAFLGAWFFLTLAPSSSVVPIATEVAAERRVYLALASILVLAYIAWDDLRRRAFSEEDRSRKLALAAVGIIGASYVILSGWKAQNIAPDHLATQWAIRLGIGVAASVVAWFLLRGPRPVTALGMIVAGLMAVTTARSLLYRNPEALWRDAVLKAPLNPRAYDNLAFNLFYDDPPRLAEAKQLYWQALSLDSTYLHAWPGLASIAVDEGKPTDAIWLLQRALAINPDYADAVDHLGKLYLTLGQPARALPYLTRFAEAYPSDSSLIAFGQASMQVGRLDDAAAALQRALSINPRRADAAEYLGGILVEQERGAEAVPLLERAAQVRGSAVSLGLLSLAFAETGRPKDAAQAASAAADRAGNNSSVYVLAGRAMLLAKQPQSAADYLSRAVQLSPSDPDALTRLGQAMIALGKPGDAVQLFRRALTLSPGYAPARQSLDSIR